MTLLSASIAAETLLAQSATTGAPGVGDVAPPMDPTPIVEAENDAARDYLSNVGQQLRGHGLTVDTEYPEGDAADVIVRRAKELGVSLILMTTHGRSGLARAVFGSVADAVLRHAPCPVMLVRISDRREDQS